MPLASLTGSATSDLGMGDLLAQQVAGETEEERKKRMREMQQRQTAPGGGSLAATMLYGAGALGGVGKPGY